MLSILNIFPSKTRMIIHLEKTTLYSFGDGLVGRLERLFNIPIQDSEMGIKYLGYIINPNKYRRGDWNQLIARIESKVNHWYNIWILRGGCLVLIKPIIKSMLIYWHTLASIPKGVLNKINQICANYNYNGNMEYKGAHWARWGFISKPKKNGD